ncbi:uncharacterized protein LOC110973720 [Acanthaster planci]|uniref:Uncharacterized protein LOC110973720 n=1 Tax=Acanthaster planci TaxID=133434 RepID=A0A8B7XI14_ACAPL|nr:uncharacterized protein LOC110973720 [Acanthaster planci]
MWYALLICVLVVGAMASKPGTPIGSTHGVGQQPGEGPELCCVPRYLTFKQVTTMTSVKDGSLSVEYENIEGAYDARFERTSIRLLVDYFNNTEVHLKVINDYRQGVSYRIQQHQGKDVCFVNHLKRKFPEDCLTENDKFLGKTTLGDHDLVVNNWYYLNSDKTKHKIVSVQQEGCVPVRVLSRKFDFESGKEIKVEDSSIVDLQLGICDPDKYFKPPPSCDKGRALDKPTPQMLKYHGKGLFRR